MAGRSSSRILAIVAALLIVGGAAGAWWLLQGSEGSDDAGPQADGTQEARPATPEEDDPLGQSLPDALGYEEDAAEAQAAAAVLGGMTSDEDVEAGLAAGTRELVDDVDGALPAGTVLTPREETWARRGNLAAMLVEVEPPGAETPDMFLVWFVRDPQDEEGWLLSSTELLEGPFEEPNVEGAG